MKVTTIDRPTLKALRPVIEKALRDAGIEGANFRLGNASFVPGSCATFKLEVALIKKDGTVETKDAAAWQRYANLYNLPADGVGKIVTLNGKRCKIIGFAPRSHKYPVLANDLSSGKTFKFMISTVQRAFGVKVSAYL